MVSKNVAYLIQYINDNNGKVPERIALIDEKLAFSVCKYFELRNVADCFIFFACANLCNAYVKKPYAVHPLKKHKGYGFKRFVGEKVAQLLISNIEGVKVHHSTKFTVVDICGMMFSYHDLGVKDAQENISFKNAEQIWSKRRLKLQPFAQEIYEEALTLVSGKKISEKNQGIFNEILQQLLSDEKLTESENDLDVNSPILS